jgi:hypothetical protein
LFLLYWEDNSLKRLGMLQIPSQYMIKSKFEELIKQNLPTLAALHRTDRLPMPMVHSRTYEALQDELGAVEAYQLRLTLYQTCRKLYYESASALDSEINAFGSTMPQSDMDVTITGHDSAVSTIMLAYLIGLQWIGTTKCDEVTMSDVYEVLMVFVHVISPIFDLVIYSSNGIMINLSKHADRSKSCVGPTHQIGNTNQYQVFGSSQCSQERDVRRFTKYVLYTQIQEACPTIQQTSSGEDAFFETIWKEIRILRETTPFHRFQAQIVFTMLSHDHDHKRELGCVETSSWKWYQTLSNMVSIDSMWTIEAFTCVVIGIQQDNRTHLCLTPAMLEIAVIENIMHAVQKLKMKEYRAFRKYLKRIHTCVSFDKTHPVIPSNLRPIVDWMDSLSETKAR